MDERHLNVRWIDHTSVLLQSITRKLEQEELVDVELVCEGQILKCHRLILSACSPFFDQVFSEQPDPNSNLVIFLKDTKFWELKALVHFMYSGEVEISQEKLPELFVAAAKLKVRGLADNVYGNSSPAASTGGEKEGTGDGDERSEEEKQQQSDAYDMVDVLQYGAEANQRSVSGGGHQKQPRKSVLRPLSNLPSLPKLQGMKHKGQLEPPRAAKFSKRDGPSLGAASSNGANAEHELKIYRQQGMKKENTGRHQTREKPYLCEFPGCTKGYFFRQSLKTHIRSHTGEKPYMCELPGCTKAYSTKDALKIHVKLHSGEKPYMCKFRGCTKAYSRPENLKIHLRSHTGEKPYICRFPGCIKAFSNSSDRATHQNYTHSKEKPFVCKAPNCNKRCTDPSSLRKHVKKVHGPDFYAKKKHKGNDHDHHPRPGHRMDRDNRQSLSSGREMKVLRGRGKRE